MEPNDTPTSRTPARPRAARRDGPEALAVEWWPIERPVPYARNPRHAPEAAIAKVAASLKEYG